MDSFTNPTNPIYNVISVIETHSMFMEAQVVILLYHNLNVIFQLICSRQNLVYLVLVGAL